MLRFNKKETVFFLYLLLLLTGTSLVCAIGISPADAYVNFVPNHEYVIDYSITSYRPFEFYTEGRFSEYTRIETKHHTDTQGVFRVYLTLPAEYDTPGKHRMYVAAKEKTMPGTVNAVAAIRGFIEIDVPFPGYYADMQLFVEDVNEGEPVLMSVIAYNRGKMNITDAKVKMSIISDKTVVKTYSSDEVFIETTASHTFSQTIPGGELRPGKYTLKVLLSYEGKTREEELDFRVGTFDVAITNYTNTMFNNSVNLFEIEIESLWNNRMDTVYLDLNIKNGSKILSSAKTPPFDLLPWAKRKSSFYWNTQDIPVGEYDLEIVLHYDGQTRTENRKIFITDKQPVEVEKPVPVSTIILVTLAVLLVIFNIYFITKDRKRKDKEEPKQKKK